MPDRKQQPAAPFVLLRPNCPTVHGADSFLITLPIAPADDLPEDSDLDALAALEARAYDSAHSLGRPYLRQLCLTPRRLHSAEILTPTTPVCVPTLRLALVARPYCGRGSAGQLLLTPPVGLAWLEIFSDPPATFASATLEPMGATQITRLTLTTERPAGRPFWPSILRALFTAIADLPAEFLPAEWPRPAGRRPLVYFAPWQRQPLDTSEELLAVGFTPQASAVADAFGPNRPGRLWLHANGTDPNQTLTVTTAPR